MKRDRLAMLRARERAAFGFEDADEDGYEGVSVAEAEALREMRAYTHGVELVAELVN